MYATNTTVLPYNSFMTCSSDNTIRTWNLDVSKKRNTTVQRSEETTQWNNPYSKEMLHIIYADATREFTNRKATLLGGSSTAKELPDNERPFSPDHSTGIKSLAIHPLGLTFATGDKSGVIKIYDVAGKVLHEQKPHEAEVSCLSYSSHIPHFLASGGRDRMVHVFDSEREYRPLKTLQDHSSAISAVKFANDGTKLFSSAGDKSLVLSHITNGRTISRFNSSTVSEGSIKDMDNDVSNKWILTCGMDKKLTVWDVNGKKRASYGTKNSLDPIGELVRVNVDPSGQYAATASLDKWIRIVDIYSGEVLAKVTGHSELITGLKFLSDGRRLVSTSADGCIFVWRLPIETTSCITKRLEQLESKALEKGTHGTVPAPTEPALYDDPPEPPAYTRRREGQSPNNYLHSILDQVPQEPSLLPPPPPVPEAKFVGEKSKMSDWARTMSPTSRNDFKEKSFKDVKVSEDDDDHGPFSPPLSIQADAKQIHEPKGGLVIGGCDSSYDSSEDSNMVYLKSPKATFTPHVNVFSDEEMNRAEADATREARRFCTQTEFEKETNDLMTTLEKDMKIALPLPVKSITPRTFIEENTSRKAKQESVEGVLSNMTSHLSTLGLLDGKIIPKRRRRKKSEVEVKSHGHSTSSPTSSSMDVANSLSKFTDGYNHEKEKTVGNPMALSITSSMVGDLTASLSAFTTGYSKKETAEIALSLKSPSERVDVSLSSFISGYEEKGNDAGKDEEDVLDVSMSSFTTGYTIETPATLTSELEDEEKEEAYASEDDVLNVSMSNFTTGYTVGVPAKASPSEPLPSPVNSTLCRSLEMNPNVSYSEFVSGYHQHVEKDVGQLKTIDTLPMRNEQTALMKEDAAAPLDLNDDDDRSLSLPIKPEETSPTNEDNEPPVSLPVKAAVSSKVPAYRTITMAETRDAISETNRVMSSAVQQLSELRTAALDQKDEESNREQLVLLEQNISQWLITLQGSLKP